MALGSVNSQLDSLQAQCTSLQNQINAISPFVIRSGMIVLWSGSQASIPAGWSLASFLADRFVVGAGSSYGVGNTGGTNSVTLTVAQLPSHNHRVKSSGNRGPGGSGREPNDWSSGATSITTTEPIGGDQSHENRPPYYALCYIIKN